VAATRYELGVMLTLAGLAYRGFHDVLPGDPHEFVVRKAVENGLERLAPVRGDWELVWGPVTSRVPLAVFDSSAMYVARHRRERHRYVVAIRGTNPVASSDWLFGDFLVATTVAWPWGPAGGEVSTSTGLGLTMLQEMRARPTSAAARFAEALASAAGNPLERLVHSGRAWLSGTSEALAEHAAALEAQVQKIVAHWNVGQAGRDAVRRRLRAAAARVQIDPADLRRRPIPPGPAGGGPDLITFLARRAETSAVPLEVALTGHSKGGALAQAVALWLEEARCSDDPAERWDAGRGARVTAYSFAGPTPGNEAFADRLEQRLGAELHHLRNTNDMVTRAWAVADLERIPGLYGSRSAVFAPLLPGVLDDVGPLKYRHARTDVPAFAGPLDEERGLVAELIHQHMDAYLVELGLAEQGIRAITFFI
jgi:hypothetical protein